MKKLENPARSVRIRGWVKTSLVDYPGRVASTLFLEGCNFRCPYCQNPELVIPGVASTNAPLDPEDILSYFSTYSRMLEGVCLTGGEPLMQPGLEDLCQDITKQGLNIKLDTNGSFPHRLEALLEANLLDYVSVDVKGPPGKIRAIAQCPMEEGNLARLVEDTVKLLQRAGVSYELRTTLVPGLLEPEDLRAIGQWMKGAPKYVLQQFRPGKTLDPAYQHVSPYPPQILRDLTEDLSVYVDECTVRGIG